MLTREEFLRPLADRRTDQIIVTTMSVVRPWGRMTYSPLDLASADSAMGHAADLALGLAMAQPKRRVICLNGDGSMLMTLGTLVTIVESGVTNLILFVVDNRQYEITGNQPIPGAATVNFAELARAAGIGRTFHFEDPAEYEVRLDEVLQAPGPVLVETRVEPGTEGPISRSESEESEYLRPSLYETARILRGALLADH